MVARFLLPESAPGLVGNPQGGPAEKENPPTAATDAVPS